MVSGGRHLLAAVLPADSQSVSISPGGGLMQSDPTLIKHLNAVLKEALTAINQYFLHAKMLGNWGLYGLGKHEYDASIVVMKHADKLMERILFLESVPKIHGLSKLLIGEDVPEMIGNDLKLETRYRDVLAKAIVECEQKQDYVSRHHLEELQEDSEERIDWLETQVSLIDRMGLENYLESAVGETEN